MFAWMLGRWLLGAVLLIVGESSPIQYQETNRIVAKDSGIVMEKPEGSINMCYYCDSDCVQDIGRHKMKASAFFPELTEWVNGIFEESGIGITFVSKYVYLSGTPDPLDNYVNKKVKGRKRLGKAMNNFWYGDLAKKKGHDCAKFKRERSCDITFYFLPITAKIIREADEGGASNMFAVCTEKSYGASSIFPCMNRTAARFAHELGHLFGMNHYDHPYDRKFTKRPFVDYAADVLAKCTGDNSTCSDAENGCIMISNMRSDRPPPSRFSECAKAYIDFWYNYAPKSHEYDNSCLKAVEDGSGSGSGE